MSFAPDMPAWEDGDEQRFEEWRERVDALLADDLLDERDRLRKLLDDEALGACAKCGALKLTEAPCRCGHGGSA